MKAALAGLIFTALVPTLAAPGSVTERAKQSPVPVEGSIQVAQITTITTTCFKTGEQVSGMNKICYYNCLGSTAAITISSVALCPLTIER